MGRHWNPILRSFSLSVSIQWMDTCRLTSLRTGLRRNKSADTVTEYAQLSTRRRPRRQRLGVDQHALRAFRRVRGFSILSALLRRFFRRKALHHEGRIFPDTSMHAAAIVP